MDKETVIKGCENWINNHKGENYLLTYSSVVELLAILKEQETIKPIYNEEKYGDHLSHCGNCEKVLPNNAVYGKVNFCPYCGRAVKLDD